MGSVIGLITDFGSSVYDGIVESVMLAISPSSRVVRIDNKVPRFSVLAGSYIVYSSYRWLPRGSVLVAVVDPGVGTRRRAVVIRTKNYTFVGPDNGLLYEAALNDGIVEVYEIDYGRVRDEAARRHTTFRTWPLSSTFHGRDVFAPAAALLAEGAQPDSIGRRVPPSSLIALRLRQVLRAGGLVRLRAVYIDEFGNVALSATPRDLRLPRHGALLTVEVGQSRQSFRFGRTFGDVRPGEGVAYVNSFGFLELAVNQGSAASALGVRVGDLVTLGGI